MRYCQTALPLPPLLPKCPRKAGFRPPMSPIPRPPVTAGVYVHWPFCAKKCPYCDFYTFGREHPDFDLSSKYLEALLAEIRGGAKTGTKAGPTTPVDTIYFGGGTPSLMEPADLKAILTAIRERFSVDPDSEITLEVNPTAAEASRLGPYRELGINRLSIGCQSFQNRYLELLGRDHDAEAARRVPKLVRELGYDNISIDLMFGLPHQTLEDFEVDLEAALELEPDHLSAYGLTLHEGTPFARWDREGRWPQRDIEHEAAMFERLIERMQEAGFEHYEISNWAKPGRASRHNQKYWCSCDVHAFGASAHGVIGGRRFSNIRNLKGYIENSGESGGVVSVEEDPPLDERSRAGEVMMLALRRLEGVGWDELGPWLGTDPRQLYAAELQELREHALIEVGSHRLRLTRRGLMVADQVMERFF